MSTWGLAMSILALLFTIASAAEPTLVVLEDGSIRGILELGVAPEAVRAAVPDPVGLHRITASPGEAKAQPDGSCLVIDSVGPQASYRSRSCPTADGWIETLVSSEQLRGFSARFRVEPAPGGSKVSYEVSATPAMPVPAFLLRSTLKSSVRDTLVKVGEKLGR